MVEVFGSKQWKLYEIVWSHVIHNFIGQINSNKGRFDRKSIKRDELSFRIHRPHFSLLCIGKPFKLCSAPWLFSGTKRNSFRVGVFWFHTSWWFPFYMFQLVPKRSFESASRQSCALEITKKRGIALADCERENWLD